MTLWPDISSEAPGLASGNDVPARLCNRATSPPYAECVMAELLTARP